MKIFILLLVLISSYSCSTSNGLDNIAEGRSVYNYIDESGKYSYIKDVKKNNGKIISRVTIKSAKGGDRVLEKSVTISQVGSISQNKKRTIAIRPMASDLLIWLNSQKYEVQQRINIKNKAMNVRSKGPENRWSSEDVKFPKGQYFCYFGQLPECLAFTKLTQRSQTSPDTAFSFHIIWESYPHNQDYLVGIGKSLFTPASIKYDGLYKGHHRYSVDVAGQSILFHYTKNFSFVRMFWVNQGISLIPQDEDIAAE